jgi:hypothetical protein
MEYTPGMADAPHNNIPDGTVCGVNPATRKIMEFAFVLCHIQSCIARPHAFNVRTVSCPWA